jgi:hypothetical protein
LLVGDRHGDTAELLAGLAEAIGRGIEAAADKTLVVAQALDRNRNLVARLCARYRGHADQQRRSQHHVESRYHDSLSADGCIDIPTGISALISQLEVVVPLKIDRSRLSRNAWAQIDGTTWIVSHD